MATSSFEQKFYVAPENIDTFIRVVTAPLSKNDGKPFKSRAVSAKEVRKRLERVLSKDGRLHNSSVG